MRGRILVTGASVAGNALAWWLARHGFAVSVVERAPGFRGGGQNVDVRGSGREVMRRMGLEARALALGTGEEGTAFVDARGRVLAAFGAGDGMTAEMEILRGDLAGLLHDAARGGGATWDGATGEEATGEGATFRFGDAIASVAQDADGVDVAFASGEVARYDVVVVAEGVGSTTREAVFAGENDPRPMDMTMAYLTIPRVAGDDRMWRWFHADRGRSVSLRPDMHGTTRAMLAMHGRSRGEDGWDVARQKALVRARFEDAGWETPRILAALDATGDFYLDVLRQVRRKSWSKGRVVLAGDAAWCITPLGGYGTTLALVGAYVLAGELARGGAGIGADGIGTASAAYERVMRPLVARVQGVPKIGPRLFHPRSAAGVQALRATLRVAGDRRVQAVVKRFSGGGDRDPPLPEYEGLAASDGWRSRR